MDVEQTTTVRYTTFRYTGWRRLLRRVTFRPVEGPTYEFEGQGELMIAWYPEGAKHRDECYVYECWTFDYTVCHPKCELRGYGPNPEDWYDPRQVAFRRRERRLAREATNRAAA